ncbi:MAG: hypothetical protein ABJB12_13410 [Pseudomonadota bacterium]
MIDIAAAADMRRADEARAKLILDIRQIKKMGDQMIRKTETVIHKTPVLLGLGAVGIALVGAAVYAGRAGSGRGLHPRIARERSFLAEAARSAALSALGILAGRITQRLLTAAMHDATDSPQVQAAE